MLDAFPITVSWPVHCVTSTLSIANGFQHTCVAEILTSLGCSNEAILWFICIRSASAPSPSPLTQDPDASTEDTEEALARQFNILKE